MNCETNHRIELNFKEDRSPVPYRKSCCGSVERSCDSFRSGLAVLLFAMFAAAV